ncbi:MAG: hypothetical protein ABR529_08895, partial [Actinomycetota bacterium]
MGKKRSRLRNATTSVQHRSKWVGLLAAGTLLITVVPSANGLTFSRATTTKARPNGVEQESHATALRAGAVAAGKKKWLFGKLSHTYEQNPVSGTVKVSTIEMVGYKGKKNTTFPRVGKVYLGSVWMGRAGDSTAGDEIVAEVVLPGKTKLAIKNSVKKRKVKCYKGKGTVSSRRLRGKKCPNRPRRGAYGWRFVPRKGFWDVPTGWWVEVRFPLRSSKRLKGLTGSPHRCLIGAIHNLSGYVLGDGWDAP